MIFNGKSNTIQTINCPIIFSLFDSWLFVLEWLNQNPSLFFIWSPVFSTKYLMSNSVSSLYTIMSFDQKTGLKFFSNWAQQWKKKISNANTTHLECQKNNANFASIYNNATKKCNSRVHQKISISKSLKNKKKENLYSYTYIHYHFRILKKRAQMPAIPLISHSMLRRLWIKLQILSMGPSQGERVCIRGSEYTVLFCPAKVSLKVFSISLKIISMYCAHISCFSNLSPQQIVLNIFFWLNFVTAEKNHKR